MNRINFFIYLKAIPYVIIFTCGIVFQCCVYDKDENYYCNPPIPDTISFGLNVLPIIKSYCSIPDCHSGGSPEGNLNLEDPIAYTSLSKPGSGYINLVNPTKSILYSQLISSTMPMPPTGNLDSCSINLVLKWIQQGAKNN